MPARIKEFHSIMPIGNIPSVLAHGILSHEKALGIPHKDVSLSGVQAKRASKCVPNGLRLHEYVNLYFHARNPMMYKRKFEAEQLCVLKISKQIVHEKGVVLTDQNAVSEYVRFLSKDEYNQINYDWVFAESWQDADQFITWRKSSAKCAEILVPEKVPSSFIEGAYVVNEYSSLLLMQQGFDKPIEINPDLFFG